MLSLYDEAFRAYSDDQLVEMLEAHERHQADGGEGPSALEQAIARRFGMSTDDPNFSEARDFFFEISMGQLQALRRETMLDVGHLTSDGAHARYEIRRVRWRRENRSGWRLRHAGWWWLHNLVAHPLLGVLPVAAVVRLHDWSSGRLGRSPSLTSPVPQGRSPSLTSPVPQIPHRWRWLVHNVGAHVAIGLWPCAATFRWHDQTAEWMEVRGWV